MLQRDEKAGWQRSIRVDTWRLSLAGYIVIAALAGALGYWAAAAPLSGAAVTSGVVAAAGRNIVIQHPDGGVIQKINVREGDHVKAGEPMMVLDPTIAQAQLNRYLKQFASMTVRASRLEAVRDGADQMQIHAEALPPVEGLDIAAIVREERLEFEVKLSRYHSELSILRKRLDVTREAVEGLAAQKKAGMDQLAIVEREIDRKKRLLDQGLTNRSEYTLLLRSQAGLVGQIGQFESQIGSMSIQTVEAREQIERLKTARVEAAVSELNSTRAAIADLEEQISAAREAAQRTVIHAPADGIVVRSVHNAEGGVVRAGEPVFELLPTAGPLIVEAHLRPQDINLVRVGQEANMRFPSLNRRTTPEIEGTLSYVSADRSVAQGSGESYYTVRLLIDDNLPEGISAEEIYPGMPVEVFIRTGKRTFLEYLVKPIVDSFSRAFREQ